MLRRRSLPPRCALVLSVGLLCGVGLSMIAAPGARGVFGALLAAIMLAIAIVDAQRFIIPNPLTAAALVLALLYASMAAPDAGWQSFALVAARAIVASLPLLLLSIGYRRWRGRDGLGLGDVKLAACAGAWVDWMTIAGVIELAALAALMAYLLRSFVRGQRMSASAALPFGLFFAPAIWIGWLVETIWFY